VAFVPAALGQQLEFVLDRDWRTGDGRTEGYHWDMHDMAGTASRRITEKPNSLHDRILGDIQEKIVSGAWAPGHRLPSEVELAEQYGCSRMTVNKVLSLLSAARIVERRRRAGSFVAFQESQSAVLQVRDVSAEIRALKLEATYAITSRVERPARGDDFPLIGVTEGVRLLEVECMHFADRMPFCHEYRIINLAAVPEGGRQYFVEEPPESWIMAKVPWTAAEHTISAGEASPDMAKALDLKPAAACLVVERRTWRMNDPVTYARLVYPANEHKLVARFSPSQVSD
jgi:GntR family histidine utilization transcriptional repressor